VQEEVPSLGKPVLVMRENTERPGAFEAGTVKLIGTDEKRIFAEVTRLLHDSAHFAAMANAVNPYGDGKAAAGTVAAIEELLGVGYQSADFSGGRHAKAAARTPCRITDCKSAGSFVKEWVFSRI
jgi:UDP-N-acetylglucosamine 2-epimerase (non-hydrolysing)